MKKLLILTISIISVIACNKGETPQPIQSLTLSADKNEILADGEQIVTFTIKDDKEAVVEDLQNRNKDEHAEQQNRRQTEHDDRLAVRQIFLHKYPP